MPYRLKPPRPVSIRRKVIYGFAFVLVMVAAITIVTWRSTQAFMATAESVAHSRRVLESGEMLLRNLMEMESARRSYLLTGDERHLEAHAAAEAEVIASFTTMRALTEDSNEQSARTDKLQFMLSRSFAEQREEIDAYRQEGFDAALARFEARDSEDVTRNIYALVREFERFERDLMLQRTAFTEELSETTTIVIIVGAAITFIALISAGWMILRDIAARRRAEDALAQQTNLLSSIIDTMPDYLFVKDAQGHYVLQNAAHRRYLGLREGEEVDHHTVHDLFPKELAEMYERDDQYVLETGAPIRNREEPARPAVPRVRWLSTTKMPLRDVTGKIIGLVGVSADITERKAAEEKLQRFAEQLERSNAELQNFASVASHDLQEPLRKILAFTDRLKAKAGDSLNDAGRDYLARIENAAHRMQTLIQDLLKLSRITSRAQPFQKCDLGQIVRDVLSDLEIRIAEQNGTIEYENLPTIDADPLQMRQLFQNLIANALKFRKPDVPPVITITSEIFDASDHSLHGAQPGEKVARITVRDNGIGFDQKFAEQIFITFQRLHTRQEYEGTGIGLAVCRKITDRHGGTIVAQSAEGQGATFIITLPVKQHLQSSQ